jgi:hypothetical protein
MKDFSVSRAFGNVLLSSLNRYPSPTLIVVKCVQPALLNELLGIIRLLKLYCQNQSIFPWPKYNEVIRLAVFRETDIELVVLQFEPRVEISSTSSN